MGDLADLAAENEEFALATAAEFNNRAPRRVSLEKYGATGDDADLDTAALQAVAALSNVVVVPYPGRTYYIKTGVRPGDDVYFDGVWSWKLKMGVGGFASKDIGATNRYAETQLVFHWDGAEGGGFKAFRFTSDAPPFGGGGDYIATPVAQTGGGTLRPVQFGLVYVQDNTLMGGAVVFNGVATPGNGPKLAGLIHVNCGTSKGNDWWTIEGSPASTINPTGLSVDADTAVFSAFSEIGPYIARGLVLTGKARADYGPSTDGITLAGVGVATAGGNIEYIDAKDVGETLDCQASNWTVGPIRAENCTLAVKLVHGAQNFRCGPVHAVNTDLCAVGIYGSADAPGDTFNAQIGPVTGSSVAERSQLTGTLASATSTTAVLPVAAEQINDLYSNAGSVLYITGGAGAGQERAITDYVGSTRTLTISPAWSVTPDNTSTFKIFATDNRATLLLASESTRKVRENVVTLDHVVNGGYRKYDVYCNLSLATSNNRVTLNADAGGTLQAVAGGGVGVRVAPGANLRTSKTQLALGGTQTFTDSGAGQTQTLDFSTVTSDTYQRSGSTNPQASTSEKGIRVLSPGLKRVEVSVKFGADPATPLVGDILRLIIKRNGTAIRTERIAFPSFTDEAMLRASIDIDHLPAWFGGNQNLYTADMLYASGGAGSVAVAVSSETYFSVTG